MSNNFNVYPEIVDYLMWLVEELHRKTIETAIVEAESEVLRREAELKYALEHLNRLKKEI